MTGAIGVVAFLQFGEIRPILLAAGSAFAITTLEGFLLTPWLTSRAARMNAVAVFVGLLFWGWVWGVWGTLLAVPMLMVVKAVCDRVEDLNRSASSWATEEFTIVNCKFTANAERSNRPRAARSGFHRSPTFSTRSGTLLMVKSSIVTPRSTSLHVTGVDTVASGRGRTE